MISAPRARANSNSSSTSTPHPSACMKPSRSRSNGREMPTRDSAVMLAKPCRPVGELEHSEPPASITSQRPWRISSAALPMDWVAEAQAVEVDSQGPW